MEQIEQTKKQLSPKQKLNILFATLAGLGVGGVLGIIAYFTVISTAAPRT